MFTIGGKRGAIVLAGSMNTVVFEQGAVCIDAAVVAEGFAISSAPYSPDALRGDYEPVRVRHQR